MPEQSDTSAFRAADGDVFLPLSGDRFQKMTALTVGLLGMELGSESVVFDARVEDWELLAAGVKFHIEQAHLIASLVLRQDEDQNVDRDELRSLLQRLDAAGETTLKALGPAYSIVRMKVRRANEDIGPAHD